MGKAGDYVRFTLGVFFGPAACGGVIFALVRWRPALEPVVKVVDWWLMGRRMHGGYSYDPDRYWLYVAIFAVAGLITGVMGVWALADKPASDRRLARYLNRQIENQDTGHHRSL